ncbi:MAG: response regulator transcription factor [Actinobacteria bacterium]|nr:response regulator transcription factor [Actinomycetota bacterium]
MDEQNVSVLVVDDQAPFRDAARAVLERTRGFSLVGEAVSGEQAEVLVEELAPSLVVMDINMGAIDGIEATRRITARHPGLMVVLCSTYPVDDLPPGVRTSGAAAYVHKEELSGRILRRLWERGGDPGFRSSAISGS